MRSKLSIIVVILIFLLGLGITLYPSFSNWLAVQNQMKDIQTMENKVEEMSQEECERIRQEANVYNQALRGENIQDPFIPGSGIVLPDNYNDIMDLGEGVMAEIIIPSIDVDLPIYHGTEEETLRKGAGHLKQTAFPVGGEGTHCVISGHTGLPGARLFTDLNQLKMGDTFYVKSLNETLAYEVEQISVVEPNDTTKLKPETGKDYLTMITCTPYGVNSHRLLVRGVRIPYTPEAEEEGSRTIINIINLQAVSWVYVAVAIGAVVLVIVILLVIIFRKEKKKSKEQTDRRNENED